MRPQCHMRNQPRQRRANIRHDRRTNAQTRTRRDDCPPWQTHTIRYWHGISSQEVLPWLSIDIELEDDEVLEWMSDGSEVEIIAERIELSIEAEVEIGTDDIDGALYGSTPAAKLAIEYLPPVLAPDAEVEDCTICMAEMCPQDRDDRIAKLPCGHLFHGNCIVKWLCNHDTCPMCRFKLRGVADE